MKRSKFFIAVIVLLIVINLITVGSLFLKQHGRNSPSPRQLPNRETPEQVIVKRLNFNATQQQQFKTLIKEHQRNIASIEKEKAKDKRTLFTLLSHNNQSDKDSLIQRLAEHQSKIENTHFQHFLDVKQLCTQDQIPKFNELSKELARLFHKRPGNLRPR